ncbi:alpha,alpha-trehalase nth1, partial [Teratosphaeriaceae sp. CCFEE 6253]
MRTSRVSRETQRIVTALSPTTVPGSRRSIRSRPVANEDYAESNAQALNTSAGTADRSDLSSAPASPATTLGKRKWNGADTPSTFVTSLSAEATAVRRSPRKAPKLEANGDATATKRKAKRQPTKHIQGPTGDLAVEPPANWEKVWSITA